MAKMSVWYDKEGDFLEVTFREAKGYGICATWETMFLSGSMDKAM